MIEIMFFSNNAFLMGLIPLTLLTNFSMYTQCALISFICQPTQWTGGLINLQKVHICSQSETFAVVKFSGYQRIVESQDTVRQKGFYGSIINPFSNDNFFTERGYRRQFKIWWKWQKVLQKGRKHWRNCSLQVISLLHTVFSKDLYCRHVKAWGFVWETGN